MTNRDNKNADYMDGFATGSAYASEKLRESIAAVIASVILETRRECAEICRRNGDEISAAEINSMGEGQH